MAELLRELKFLTKEDYIVKKSDDIPPLTGNESRIVWFATSIEGIVKPFEGEMIDYGEWNEDDIKQGGQVSLRNENARWAFEKLHEFIYFDEICAKEPVGRLCDFVYYLLRNIEFSDNFLRQPCGDYVNIFAPTKDGVFLIREEGSFLENRKSMAQQVDSMKASGDLPSEKAPFTVYNVYVKSSFFIFQKVIYSDNEGLYRRRLVMYPLDEETNEAAFDLSFCDPEKRKVILRALYGLRSLVRGDSVPA